MYHKKQSADVYELFSSSFLGNMNKLDKLVRNNLNERYRKSFLHRIVTGDHALCLERLEQYCVL